MPSDLSTTERVYHFVFQNAIQTDAAEAEAKLRGHEARLLQESESVKMAFKIERDHFYFTTTRILFKNKKGPLGQRISYRSLPYAAIKAFAVQSTGVMFDGDSELRIWTDMYQLGYVVMNFAKGKVDIFEVQAFFNAEVLPRGDVVEFRPPPRAPSAEARPEGGVEGFLNWLADDAREIDAATIERQLQESPKVLQADERVELAYRCGRDSTVFTTKRILLIDVKGWSGKMVEYRSVLYSTIRAFSVQTAGETFDRDAEIRIWTSMPMMRVIGQDLRKGKADVLAVQRHLSDRVLGKDTEPLVDKVGAFRPPGGAEAESDFLGWLGDDMRQIDAKQADAHFHTAAPVLQGDEHVELAFKGRRDMMLLTTKRIVSMDIKAFSGKKIQYLSVPYSSVQAFAVRSAGSFMDKDSEMMIWTDIMYEPGEGDNPPQPGMSYLEQDFQKDSVDLMAIHRYLSARVLGFGSSSCGAAPAHVPAAVFAAGPADGVESFLSWIGDDAHQVDARAVEEQLRTVNPMLQDDERVELAYRSGRDMLVLSTRRALLIDTQGWTGKKVQYTSVPYTSLRGFSVESAGAFDRDAEVKLYLRAPWLAKLGQDLRKGKADVVAIQAFLAEQVLGKAAGAPPPPQQGSAAAAPGVAVGDTLPVEGLDGFLAWIGDNAKQLEVDEVDRQLHTSPAILQADESVAMAFKVGRDMCLFTTKRVLLIDVQGWTGKKVEYKSFPYRHCPAFSVQTAGKLDWDAEAVIWTDCPGHPTICQDLWKGKADVFAVQKTLNAQLLPAEADVKKV
mmetsp:Transcript_43399/g.114772  ORF Transcript_43399/g.114772 Transcript_43399/m.114772 type:complete len:786 (-) Transcript_43399:312-2669(-)